jgi:N-methylhydantoinase A
VTRSNGGIMTLAAARSECVSTLLSGPAAGVIGAADVAVRAGFDDLVTFDMGGTSADVAIVEGGTVTLSREEHVGDFPIIMPAIGISSIGMGGGSIAWLDAAGVLKVGPESAGADPGPACYGLGGVRPTVADAFVLCGYLNPERFAGGRSLDVGAAAAALGTIAANLGIEPVEAADAAIQVALASMYTELSGVLDRRGIDPRDFVAVAFGGAGPVLACQLAAAANIGTVLVPPSPGTLSASGALQASIRSEFVRGYRAPLAAVDGTTLRAAFEQPLARATAWLEREAPPVAGTRFLLSADLRYLGQGYELEVPVNEAVLDGATGELAAAFHTLHDQRFAHADPASDVEITSLRVSAMGSLPAVERHDAARRTSAPPDMSRSREIRCEGELRTARVLWRDALEPGESFEGPAVLEQPDTTTIVPPAWTGRADDAGNVVLTRG